MAVRWTFADADPASWTFTDLAQEPEPPARIAVLIVVRKRPGWNPGSAMMSWQLAMLMGESDEVDLLLWGYANHESRLAGVFASAAVARSAI